MRLQKRAPGESDRVSLALGGSGNAEKKYAMQMKVYHSVFSIH